MRPKKVTVTETVTAELVPPAARRASRRAAGDQVADAIAVTNTLVVGAAPAVAMGGSVLAVFASAAHAAHGATAAQHGAATMLAASTVTGVATLLQPPARRAAVRDPGPARPCCKPGATCAKCRPQR
jgi:hypothetical protein